MRPRFGGSLLVVILGLFAVVAMGCVPVVKPAGLATTVPALDDDCILMRDGTRLPLRAWLPETGDPKAIVIAVHGFNDYSRFFERPAAFFAAHGVASFAYDQRGFGGAPDRGKWPGTATLADDLITTLGLVHQRYPNVPIFVLGNSMGSAVVVVAMTNAHVPHVEGVILSAPAVWGWRAQPWYQRAALWTSAHTVPWLRLSGRGLGIRPSDNDTMLRDLSRDPFVIKETRIDSVYGLVTLMETASEVAGELDVPSLVLYGANDQLVPPEPLRRLLRDIPLARDGSRARFAYYEDGFHMLLRDLQGETVWKDVLAWIENPSEPLPSAADRYAIEAGACPASAVCAIVPSVRTRSSAG